MKTLSFWLKVGMTCVVLLYGVYVFVSGYQMTLLNERRKIIGYAQVLQSVDDFLNHRESKDSGILDYFKVFNAYTQLSPKLISTDPNLLKENQASPASTAFEIESLTHFKITNDNIFYNVVADNLKGYTQFSRKLISIESNNDRGFHKSASTNLDNNNTITFITIDVPIKRILSDYHPKIYRFVIGTTLILFAFVGLLFLLLVILKFRGERLEKAGRDFKKRLQESAKKADESQKQYALFLDDLQIREKQILQRENLALIGNLTANVSDIIKNPLQKIHSLVKASKESYALMFPALAADMGISADLIEDMDMAIKKMDEHAQRAMSIYDSMDAHAHSQPLEKKAHHLNEFIGSYAALIIYSLKAQHDKFNPKVVIQYDQSVGDVVFNADSLGRVLVNILDNAAYAMIQKAKQMQGSYQPIYTIKTEQLDAYVQISITDNGFGIKAEDLDKVFNSFFSTKPSGEGTGLGLSMSYNTIVNEHGGKLTVDSQLGEYTKFNICLPCGV